jgi:hypothetical protein
MRTIKFHPGQSFDEVRMLLATLNLPEFRNHVAKLTWRDGTAKDETVTYFYDPFAERFGHQVDKEPIGLEIINSLIVGIAVDVTIAPKRKNGGE